MPKKENIRPVILMLGGAAVGKSTIAQSIFGDEKINSDESSFFNEHEGSDITIYDSLTVNIAKGEDYFIDEIKSFIDEIKSINTFYYVIDGSGGRVTDSDMKIINTLPKKSTIVIISKSDIAKTQQIEAITKKLTDSNIEIAKIAIVDETGSGIDELKKLTYKTATKSTSKIDSTEKSMHKKETTKNEKNTEEKPIPKKTSKKTSVKKTVSKDVDIPKDKQSNKQINTPTKNNSEQKQISTYRTSSSDAIIYLGFGLASIIVVCGIKKIIDTIIKK